LRKSRAAAKDKARAHLQCGVRIFSVSPGGAAEAAESPAPHGGRASFAMGSSANTRDLSAARSSSIRRRSTSASLPHHVALDPSTVEDLDDDGVGSVYSTSSSQRSDDEKRAPLNFFHLMRSGKTTPVMDSMEPHEGAGDVTNVPEGTLHTAPLPPTGGSRRKSLGQHLGTAPANASPQNKAVAKLKLRERLFLSAQPTMRLGGNTNQMRLDRVRPNPEEDEAAKARARVPQVPVAKLTPRMRARVAGLTLGEKKDVCRVDENGKERNELNAKLYECYHGRF
jgi:hypothetical protein